MQPLLVQSRGCVLMMDAPAACTVMTVALGERAGSAPGTFWENSGSMFLEKLSESALGEFWESGLGNIW